MNILLVAVASALLGIIPSIQKNIMAGGVTPIALVTICNGFAALIPLLICLVKHISLKVNRKQFFSLFLIGAIGLFTTDYLLDISYTLIPVGYVTMIHFSFPTLVCVVMVLFFKEKFTKFKAFAIVLSVCGLILLAGSKFSGSAIGIVTSLITSCSYTFYMIASDKTPAAQVNPVPWVFYTNATVAVVSLLFWIPETPGLPSSISAWGQCFLVGVMLCAGIFMLNLGITKIGAGTASFLNMVEPVVSFVVSTVVYSYDLTVAAVAGCVLILGSMAFAAKK